MREIARHNPPKQHDSGAVKHHLAARGGAETSRSDRLCHIPVIRSEMQVRRKSRNKFFATLRTTNRKVEDNIFNLF